MTCLRRAILIGFKAVFVHDPVGLVAVGSPALVIHQGLPHANQAVLCIDGLVPPRRLPEPGARRPVGAGARRVLLVLVAEEVPVVLLLHTDLALVCFDKITINITGARPMDR